MAGKQRRCVHSKVIDLSRQIHVCTFVEIRNHMHIRTVNVGVVRTMSASNAHGLYTPKYTVHHVFFFEYQDFLGNPNVLTDLLTQSFSAPNFSVSPHAKPSFGVESWIMKASLEIISGLFRFQSKSPMLIPEGFIFTFWKNGARERVPKETDST